MADQKARSTVLSFWADVIKDACSRETSSDEDGWRHENPTWGHCAVAALLTQAVLGGTLLRYDLSGTPFAAMRSHYRNRLPDGTVEDFTEEQFAGGITFADLPDPVERAREEVLDPVKYPKTVERYAKFKERANKCLSLRLDGVLGRETDDGVE